MRDLTVGLRYLGRGQRWAAAHRRWFGFGMLPALVTFVLYAAALTALAFHTDAVAVWATPFADDWDGVWRDTLRTVFAVLFWLAGLFISVITFTAVTLLVGDPFYEKLSEKVEESEGHCPEGPDRPLHVELWIGVCDSLFVLWRTVLLTAPLFALGFVPVAGQILGPALGFCVAGFFLTLELASVAMQRRGIPVRERLRILRRRRALALGFGVPLVLAFLVPFVAVVLMPGAVAGAALLVRDLMGDGDGDGEAEEDGERDDEAQPRPEPGPRAPESGVSGPKSAPHGGSPR